MRPCVKCATCDHASNASHATMRQMRLCVKYDHASNATMSFQNSFCYGRVSLGIGYIADKANFFARAYKTLSINREKIDKILKGAVF